MATDWTSATGPNAAQISSNASASIFGIASGLEAFLYLLGIALFIAAICFAWRHHAKTMQGGGRSQDKDDPAYVIGYLAMFALSAMSFAAPTLMGSMRGTLFEVSTSVTSVQPPGPSFTGQ